MFVQALVFYSIGLEIQLNPSSPLKRQRMDTGTENAEAVEILEKGKSNLYLFFNMTLIETFNHIITVISISFIVTFHQLILWIPWMWKEY